MNKTKKAIMFLVEGPTDENALSPIFDKIFERLDIHFHVVYGDITCQKDTTSANILIKINQHIQQEMKRYGLKNKDIIQIVHIIDTDGAFVPDSAIKYGDNEKIIYNTDSILTSNIEAIKERNYKKSNIFKKLIATKSICRNIPYTIYYFSRNMEHVLHNNSNDLSDEEKIEYADLFADKYVENPSDFIDFMKNSAFTVSGTYMETCKFIMQDLNSLHRHSNLNLIFKDESL